MSYPDGHVERFAAARNIINDASKSPLTDQVALKLEGKVGMTLEAYEAIAATMTNLQPEPVLLQVPARHLQAGDHLWGYSIYQWKKLSDGSYQWDMVEPYTTKSFSLIVEERKLDELSFPITKRGDAHSPTARNIALGLPEDLHQIVYTETHVEPIATYPVGTKVGDVHHFDRGQKVLFACPTHPESAWASKDPHVSVHFPQSDATVDCMLRSTHGCNVPLIDYVLTHEYNPTRNG